MAPGEFYVLHHMTVDSKGNLYVTEVQDGTLKLFDNPTGRTNMCKSMVVATCLAFASIIAFATPRTLLPEEGQIEFVVKEMGVPVPGKFKRFEAAIDIDPVKPEKSSANVRIDIGSLATGNEEADAIAVGPDWLDKAHAPYATFKSVSMRELGRGRYEAKGTLNIRNKERDIVIQFSTTDQAAGKTVINSEFIIKRSEFGIGAGVWNEGGVVAEEIPVKIRFTLTPAATKSSPTASR
jgi:polyisoprenoid-binding protein YceI